MSALEVTGRVVFLLILVMLTIPVIRAILRIMRACQYKTENYNLDNSPSHKDSEDNMEAAWEELAENPDSTIEASHNPPTNEEIISANKDLCSAIESSRRNLKLYKNEA